MRDAESYGYRCPPARTLSACRRAEALLARSRSRPAGEQAIALYGRPNTSRARNSSAAGHPEIEDARRTLGARSWVEFVSTQLDVSHDDARLVLRTSTRWGPSDQPAAAQDSMISRAIEMEPGSSSREGRVCCSSRRWRARRGPRRG